MKVKIGDKTIEVPQGVEVKVIEDEPERKPERKFKVGDYVEYEGYKGAVYQIVRLTFDGYVTKKVRKSTEDNELPSFDIYESNVSDWKLLPDYEEIIDEWGDAHDPDLRMKINDAWNKNREGFQTILRALYYRDIDEITDHDAFHYPDWENTPEYKIGRETGIWCAYNSMAYEHMCLEWDFYAGNYLNHIADDGDLECILNFLHYPYLPIFQD